MMLSYNILQYNTFSDDICDPSHQITYCNDIRQPSYYNMMLSNNVFALFCFTENLTQSVLC
jgi:hypothetical protein